MMENDLDLPAHGLLDLWLCKFLLDQYGDDHSFDGLENRDCMVSWPINRSDVREGIDRVSKATGKTLEEIIYDAGLWITRQESIRRLLRFCGRDFEEFLQSVQELPGRVNLIYSSEILLDLRLSVERKDDNYIIHVSNTGAMIAHLVGGVIQGMADDYGTLAVVDVDCKRIEINVASLTYQRKKSFRLSGASA